MPTRKEETNIAHEKKAESLKGTSEKYTQFMLQKDYLDSVGFVPGIKRFACHQNVNHCNPT